jgi:serine/threonine-protein kinase
VDTIVSGAVDAAADEQTGHLFVAAGTELDMLDGSTGALLKADDFAGPRLHVDAVAVDPRTWHAFSANWGDDTVSMVDTRSGQILRTVHVGHLPVAVAVDGATGKVFIANNGAGAVSVLDAQSGALLRTVPVGPHPAKVVVDERTSRVFVLHGRGGNRKQFYWSDPQGDAGFPDIRQGGTTMLDARTGAVLRTVPAGGSVVDDLLTTATLPPNIAVDSRRSRVFVIDQATYDRSGTATSSSISVLDSRSGQVLRSIAVGRNPMALAVDEATARLFVVNTNSGCVRPSNIGVYVPTFVRHVLPFLPAPSRTRCNMPGSVTVIDTSRL